MAMASVVSRSTADTARGNGICASLCVKSRDAFGKDVGEPSVRSE